MLAFGVVTAGTLLILTLLITAFMVHGGAVRRVMVEERRAGESGRGCVLVGRGYAC